MEKIRKHAATVFVVALVLLASADGSETQVTATRLVFATPNNEGVFTAYMAAVYEEVGRRMGIPCTLVELPKKRCLTDADKGLYDGVAARVTGLDAIGYRNLIRINLSHYTVQHMVFGRAGEMTGDVNNIVNLMDAAQTEGFLIGYLQGSKQAEQLLENLPQKNKIALDRPEQAFRMLKNGRIGAYLAGPGIVNRAVLKQLKNSTPNDNGLQSIEELFIVSESQLFPYLHAMHEKLIPAFEATLRSMKEDGTLDTLFQAVQ